MSKYTNGALQVLEAADTDINQTFTYTEETSECVILFNPQRKRLGHG